MNRIESFTINHLKLESGLYVSRRDEKDGVVITTFDMRITAPNKEPVVDTPALPRLSICAQHIYATAKENWTLYILDRWVAEQVAISLCLAI